MALKAHLNRDGLKIEYTYDLFKRITSKIYLDSRNKKIAEEIFTYDSFHMLSKKDKDGNITTYKYDKAGKKIEENFEGRITKFFYDDLGRLCQICKLNDKNTFFINYKRDLLGRIIEKNKKDILGNILYKISYRYDEDGNRNEVIRSIDGKRSIEEFYFDSFKRIVIRKDPLGNLYRTFYNEKHINILGQKTLQVIEINPKNIKTVDTKDAYFNIVKKEVFDPSNDLIFSQDFFYDPEKNLTFHKNHIYEKNLFSQNPYKKNIFKKTVLTKYIYNSSNKLKRLIEAYRTKDERSTYYNYTLSGRLKRKILPDKNVLFYEYTPFGYLKNVKSKDGKIDHSFEYTNSGKLLKAFGRNQNDCHQNISVKRILDPFGNILEENILTDTNNVKIKKTYDNFNRPLSIIFLDQSKILYEYDPLFLRKVKRISNDGHKLYTHRYDRYDLSGNLLEESLLEETFIGNLGKVRHFFDRNGRELGIDNKYFSQNISYDEVGNVINSTINNKSCNYTYDGLSQITSEKDDCYMEYGVDSNYNQTAKNESRAEINDLNEVLSLGDIFCKYDLNGNLIFKKTKDKTFHFIYDPLNQLISADSDDVRVDFTYDPLGRRIEKKVYKKSDDLENSEYYLYDKKEEIGAFVKVENNNFWVKNLKILGRAPFAIELDGKIFAAILDIQGNVCRLIDINSKEVVKDYRYGAFGQKNLEEKDSYIEDNNPWRYFSKRIDPELKLIYFGKRYLDPELSRWITVDPMHYSDSMNLYQYVFNNPFKYIDQDGRFAIAIPIFSALFGVGFAPVILPAVGITVASAAIAWAGYEAFKALNSWQENRGIRNYVLHNEAVQEQKKEKKDKKNDDKRHAPDQEALNDLVKDAERKGILGAEANILLEWAEEYNFPSRDDRGKDHWVKGEHIHIGGKHIPINN